jgi:hypothetical protein
MLRLVGWVCVFECRALARTLVAGSWWTRPYYEKDMQCCTSPVRKMLQCQLSFGGNRFWRPCQPARRAGL